MINSKGKAAGDRSSVPRRYSRRAMIQAGVIGLMGLGLEQVAGLREQGAAARAGGLGGRAERWCVEYRGHALCQARTLLRLSEAKPRPGMRRRSDAAAPRCARGPLRCSITWPAEKLASLPSVVPLKQSRRVRS